MTRKEFMQAIALGLLMFGPAVVVVLIAPSGLH